MEIELGTSCLVVQCLNQLYSLYILIIRGPCIVVYAHNKTNEMHQFLKFIFGINLYMFRTVSLSLIRSLTLYTQQ